MPGRPDPGRERAEPQGHAGHPPVVGLGDEDAGGGVVAEEVTTHLVALEGHLVGRLLVEGQLDDQGADLVEVGRASVTDGHDGVASGPRGQGLARFPPGRRQLPPVVGEPRHHGGPHQRVVAQADRALPDPRPAPPAAVAPPPSGRCPARPAHGSRRRARSTARGERRRSDARSHRHRGPCASATTRRPPTGSRWPFRTAGRHRRRWPSRSPGTNRPRDGRSVPTGR